MTSKFVTEPALIGQLRARELACVAGEVRSCERVALGAGTAFRAVLGDESGELELVFLGRTLVPGFAPGRRVRAEGRVARRDRALVIYNPRYRFELGPR